MWGWFLGLRKCFGNTREQSPFPEGVEEREAATGSESSVRTNAAVPRLGSGPLEATDGTPAKQHIAASIMDVNPSPQIHSAAAVPAMRASPMLKSASISPARRPRSPAPRSTGKVAGRDPKSPVLGSRNLSLGRVANPGSYSAQHLHTARIAQVTRSSRAGEGSHTKPCQSENATPNMRKQRAASPGPRQARPGTAGRQSRLSVKTPAVGASRREPTPEEQPLKLHHTPFNVRLDRHLKSDVGGALPSAAPNYVPDCRPATSLQENEREEQGGFSRQRQPDAAITSDTALDPGRTAGSRASPGSPKRHGKENSGSAAVHKSVDMTFKKLWDGPAPQPEAPNDGVLRPPLRVALPDSGNPFAAATMTPSPTHMPRFVMTADDSFGTPNVVGVENLNTQYREDKRLRVHETPFEERVERFIETEKAWKENRMSQSS